MKLFVIALLVVACVACGDDGPSTPTSSTPTTTTTTSTPPPATFSLADGASVLFGRTSTLLTKFSARVNGNLAYLVDAMRAFTGNGASMEMYVYHQNGGRRKWATEFGNSHFEGYRSTLFKDVDTDGAVSVVFQAYPSGASVPTPFTFPYWDSTRHFQTSPGVSRTVVDGLHFLKAQLPAMSGTFGLGGSQSLRVDPAFIDDNVKPASLLEVAELVNGKLEVVCSGSCDAYKGQ